jgi:transposase
MIPVDLPPWSTSYDYFRKWRNDGTWSRVKDSLRTQVRHTDRRRPVPGSLRPALPCRRPGTGKS